MIRYANEFLIYNLGLLIYNYSIYLCSAIFGHFSPSQAFNFSIFVMFLL